MSAEAQASTADWADPGLFTVAPGVHRVPLPLPTDGLRAVNVYVVDDGDGLVLIDGGWALAAPHQEIELRRRTLRVVPTPGHTQGHVVFTDAGNGLLFAGDHVLPHITPSIGFEPVSASLPLGDFLESLRVVRALPDMRLLPAHGPVTGSAHTRIDELLAHHHDRLGQCAEAVAAGAASAYQVACALRWTRRGRRLADLDPVNQMLAVTETRAHLELLAAQGRLAASWDGEVAVYAPATASPAGEPASLE